MPITLAIASISLEINILIDSKTPRITVDPNPAVEYSVYGATIGDGRLFARKYMWDISCLLLPIEADILEAIYWEFDSKRRALQVADILIIDRSLPFIEKSPRTRAIAPDTFETVVAVDYTSYYAQFNGWFTKAPEYTEQGIYRNTHFNLTESNLVSA